MPSYSYKQKCIVCRKNHALVTWKDRTPVCVPCKMKQIDKPIEDPAFKKLFDIDKTLYERSSFLRNIKLSYIRFGKLSDKQIETFREVAETVKNRNPEDDIKSKDIPKPKQKI